MCFRYVEREDRASMRCRVRKYGRVSLGRSGVSKDSESERKLVLDGPARKSHIKRQAKDIFWGGGLTCQGEDAGSPALAGRNAGPHPRPCKTCGPLQGDLP